MSGWDMTRACTNTAHGEGTLGREVEPTGPRAVFREIVCSVCGRVQGVRRTRRDPVPERGSLVDEPFAVRWAAVEALAADGWTEMGAMAHIEGDCDMAVCCGWSD